MSNIVDETAARLSRRIRLERDARGWSLAELAERSGVSKATISKIEREEMSPTAVVLVRLAGAFDLTLAGLLLRAEGEGNAAVPRRRPAGLARPGRPAIAAARCSAGPDHPLEIVQIELPPGQRVDFPAASYAHIRQVVWVQSGELVIREGGERHELRQPATASASARRPT